MSLRIIRIAAALAGCVLLLAGCIRRSELTPDPEPTATPVRFAGRSLLIQDDATKGATPKEGTAFVNTDEPIAVFGCHAEGTGEKWVFENQSVTIFGSLVGEYTPTRFWAWQDTATDYYDFLATYPYRENLSYTKSVNTTSKTTTLQVEYNAKTDQYDLMSAGTRRRISDDPDANTAVVPFTFSHQLCAVKVNIKNESENNSFTLNYVRFKNLMVTGTLELRLWVDDSKITDKDSFSSRWISTGRDITTDLFPVTDAGTIDHGATYSVPTGTDYNLLPPQDLEPLGINPVLELSFTYGSNPATTVSPSIPLKTIETSNGTAITAWEAGRKYIYNINIRVDGGVKVNVITTDWDPVNAKTPGIMI